MRCSLWSNISNNIHVTFSFRHKLTFGSFAFRFSAPRVRNLLPVSIREFRSLPTFRPKDIFLSVSLPPFSCPSCREYLRSKTLALYKSRTYLLTHLLTYQNIKQTMSSPNMVQFDSRNVVTLSSAREFVPPPSLKHGPSQTDESL